MRWQFSAVFGAALGIFFFGQVAKAESVSVNASARVVVPLTASSPTARVPPTLNEPVPEAFSATDAGEPAAAKPLMVMLFAPDEIVAEPG